MRLLAAVLTWLLALMTLAGMMAYELVDQFVVALLLLLALEIAVTVIHEAGHAVAATRLGARLEVFAVMGVEYDFTARKFGMARSLDNQEVGGFVLYSWDEDEPVRRDEALIAAAGPAANLLLALLALTMTLGLSTVDFSRPSAQVEIVVAGSPPPGRLPLVGLPSEAEKESWIARHRQQERREAAVDWLEGFAAVLAVLSLGTALLNLLPYRGSDGERLLDALWRKRSWPRPGHS